MTIPLGTCGANRTSMRLICCSWGWDIKHLFLIWPWHWSQLQTFLFCYPFPTSQEKNMPSFWLHFMRMFEWSKEINLSQLRELRLLRKMQCLQLWLISNADFCIYMLAQSLKWFFFSLVKKNYNNCTLISGKADRTVKYKYKILLFLNEELKI